MVKGMEDVGVVVDDRAAATKFFVELGLVLRGEATVGRRLGGPHHRARGRTGGHRDDGSADRDGRLELTKFHSPSMSGQRPAPANAPGIRHIAFAVGDIDAVVAGLRARGAELVGQVERYEDRYRICYVRGPEGIIVELAEQIG